MPSDKSVSQAPTIWLTGLSGAGKSTLALCLADYFRAALIQYEILDGDELRRTLSRDLGFSKRDRDENIFRAAYVAHLLNRHGVTTIAALISPYREARNQARSTIERFLEVYVDCPLSTLVSRDTKGLYKRAAAGAVESLTGFSDPYEPPETPDVHLDTSIQSPQKCVAAIIDALRRKRWVCEASHEVEFEGNLPICR